MDDCFPPYLPLPQVKNRKPPTILSVFQWKRLLTCYIQRVQTFTSKTHHAMYTGSNHSHFFRISLLRRKVHSVNIVTKTATLKNRHPRECFPDQCILSHFKSWVNCYLFSSTSFSNPLHDCLLSLVAVKNSKTK